MSYASSGVPFFLSFLLADVNPAGLPQDYGNNSLAVPSRVPAPDAVAAIREPGDRDPRRRVEEREGGPGQESQRRIRNIELRLDRDQEHRQDLAVQEVDRIHHREEGEGGARLTAGDFLAHTSSGTPK